MTAYIGGEGTEGKKLKATSFGGTDDFGFSALPGGQSNSYGDFIEVGKTGMWWSAKDDYSLSDIRVMYNNSTKADWTFENKSSLCSVRCIKD